MERSVTLYSRTPHVAHQRLLVVELTGEAISDSRKRCNAGGGVTMAPRLIRASTPILNANVSIAWCCRPSPKAPKIDLEIAITEIRYISMARPNYPWPNVAIQAASLSAWLCWTSLTRTDANHLMALAGRRWAGWQNDRETAAR